MKALFLLDSTVAHALGWTLLHSIWQAASVVIVYLLLKQILRNQAARLRYLSGLIALFIIPVWAGITFWQQLPEPIPLVQQAPIQVPSTESINPTPEISVAPLTIPEQQTITQWSWQSMFNPIAPWLTTLWLVGILFMVLRFILGIRNIYLLRRTGLTSLNQEWQDRVHSLIQKMGLRHINVKLSDRISQPVSMGIIKPLVLVPTGMLTGLNPNQVEAILAHEFAHVQRHDFLINLIQSFIEILFFYHPLLWLLSTDIRKERELCCDDIALGYTEDNYGYAEALAQLQVFRRNQTPSLALAATGGNFTERIQRLFGAGNTAKPWQGFAAGAVLVLGLFVGAYFVAQDTLNFLGKWNAVVTFEFDGTNGEEVLMGIHEFANKHNLAIQPSSSSDLQEKSKINEKFQEFALAYFDKDLQKGQRVGLRNFKSFTLTIDAQEKTIQFGPEGHDTYFSGEEVLSGFISHGRKGVSVINPWGMGDFEDFGKNLPPKGNLFVQDFDLNVTPERDLYDDIYSFARKHQLEVYPYFDPILYRKANEPIKDFHIIYFDKTVAKYRKIGIQNPKKFSVRIDADAYTIQLSPKGDGTYYREDDIPADYINFSATDRPQKLHDWLAQFGTKETGWYVESMELTEDGFIKKAMARMAGSGMGVNPPSYLYTIDPARRNISACAPGAVVLGIKGVNAIHSENRWNSKERVFQFHASNWKKSHNELKIYLSQHKMEAFPAAFDSNSKLDSYEIIYFNHALNLYQKAGAKTFNHLEVKVDPIKRTIALKPDKQGRYYEGFCTESVFLDIFPGDKPAKLNGWIDKHRASGKAWKVLNMKYNEQKHLTEFGVEMGGIGMETSAPGRIYFIRTNGRNIAQGISQIPKEANAISVPYPIHVLDEQPTTFQFDDYNWQAQLDRLKRYIWDNDLKAKVYTDQASGNRLRTFEVKYTPKTQKTPFGKATHSDHFRLKYNPQKDKLEILSGLGSFRVIADPKTHTFNLVHDDVFTHFKSFHLSKTTTAKEFKAIQQELPVIGLTKPQAIFNPDGTLKLYFTLHKSDQGRSYANAFVIHNKLEMVACHAEDPQNNVINYKGFEGTLANVFMDEEYEQSDFRQEIKEVMESVH